jgi:predicted DNA-binding transcriptional regulator AlpA
MSMATKLDTVELALAMQDSPMRESQHDFLIGWKEVVEFTKRSKYELERQMKLYDFPKPEGVILKDGIRNLMWNKRQVAAWLNKESV